MSANARTLPIALVLIGGAIIGTAISAYAFGQRVDLAIVVVAFIIGVFAIRARARNNSEEIIFLYNQDSLLHRTT